MILTLSMCLDAGTCRTTTKTQKQSGCPGAGSVLPQRDTEGGGPPIQGPSATPGHRLSPPGLSTGFFGPLGMLLAWPAPGSTSPTGRGCGPQSRGRLCTRFATSDVFHLTDIRGTESALTPQRGARGCRASCCPQVNSKLQVSRSLRRAVLLGKGTGSRGNQSINHNFEAHENPPPSSGGSSLGEQLVLLSGDPSLSSCRTGRAGGCPGPGTGAGCPWGYQGTAHQPPHARLLMSARCHHGQSKDSRAQVLRSRGQSKPSKARPSLASARCPGMLHLTFLQSLARGTHLGNTRRCPPMEGTPGTWSHTPGSTPTPPHLAVGASRPPSTSGAVAEADAGGP